MGQWYNIAHFTPVSLAVLGLLFVASIVSWAIIAYRFWEFSRQNNQDVKFTNFLSNTSLKQIYADSKHLPQSSKRKLLGLFICEVANNDDKNMDKEHVQAQSADLIQSQLDDMESYLPFLATVGSVAPFVGLLGTVIGIMNSFGEISLQGSASLASVAPGIAESLIATAAGLLASIPAVIAYNYFTNQLRKSHNKLSGFANQLQRIYYKQLD